MLSLGEGLSFGTTLLSDYCDTPSITIVDGAGTQDPETKEWTKLNIPSCSSGEAETSSNSSWVVTLEIKRSGTDLGEVSSFVQFPHNNELVNVPIHFVGSFPDPNESLVKDHFTICLDSVINNSTSDCCIFTLQLLVDSVCHDVGKFKLKYFQMNIQVENEDDFTNGTIATREKRQIGIAGVLNNRRLQRLDRKYLEFLLRTNVQINTESVRGFVNRINDRAMIGKGKAIRGETEVPVNCVKYTKRKASNDTHHCYYFRTNLDPDEFYKENPGKELYTSDKSSPDNNIFLFKICVHLDERAMKQEVYCFRTRSKDYSGIPKVVEAVQLVADRGRIKELTIQNLTTERGDIAYTWSLMDRATAGRYEEGDVVGLFPDLVDPSDKTFIDLLTPINCKDAIVAGVITRSYYVNANSQEDGEQVCMVGMVNIKVSGAVKHGNPIFVSDTIPGIAATQNQLNEGNLRKKRLLGCSLETNTQPGVKLVNCIVSIILCVNNDHVQGLLDELEITLSKDMDDKIVKLRDDVDTKWNCMKQIICTKENQVTSSKIASRRRKGCVCLSLVLMMLAIVVACYIFLCPTSFYNTWKCHRGALSGEMTFFLDNRDAEEYISMKGALYTWESLKHKLDLDFDKKKNFTGSYYMNLRRCQAENLRNVLGWFSNPPVYYRAQVFAVDCGCKIVFHYQIYHSWKEYKSISRVNCTGQRGSQCLNLTGSHQANEVMSHSRTQTLHAIPA